MCAALLHKALPKQEVIAVHIDNGFMRKNESQCVEQSLKKIGINLKGMNLKVNVNKNLYAHCMFLVD